MFLMLVCSALADVERQYARIAYDIARRSEVNRYAGQTFHPAALIADSDKDPLDVILRRTGVLLADIKAMPDSPVMADMEKALAALQERAGSLEDETARKKLFAATLALRRRVAFSNPLLDFDRILFIKRQRATFNHMCDQYYGTYAVPGGGLFVLSNPFGKEPEVHDMLANSVVERGRLKGTKLDTGSFLSPDLSYDGKTVLFAYVECTGEPGHRRHLDHATDGHWSRGRCYHIFKVNTDGSGLEQLTDGTFNDFDPCWLPNGRVAFISERRGGYLRCGRACPLYTLHDMNPDGSQVLMLSPHESNEWHPSVTHGGRIIYTRWDYVDRHGCVAHQPWVTTPDGRDTRAVHGNFSLRNKRPDMELDLRAIPASHRFMGTAAPHHGQAYGSVVVIDPHVEDDDEMAPVKRVTPDVGFPESQNGAQAYGTPWPLSENYFLCVYDPDMKPNQGRQGKKGGDGNYGLYLADAFGNKELLYRDPNVSCLSPMPFRPRARPPVLPEASARLEQDPPKDGVMGVLNVYDSLVPWPDNTKITSLRIFQIFPMSVPSGGPPHETGFRLPELEGRDSVRVARNVVGTVPVEEDGSAHFVVPAMKGLFFQTLDKDGLAVQSMRSSAYVQPGERLVCMGCHEPKGRAPGVRAQPAIALNREPSVPTPDVEGTNPFNYVKLVQPVLDKHCVTCHQEKQAEEKKPPLLDGTPLAKGRNKFTRSFHSLVEEHGFYRYGSTVRTMPEAFGARGSNLYKLLSEGHHDVKLSEEEMHRVTLWLDSGCMFYGVYEKEGGEAQLSGALARPTLE